MGLPNEQTPGFIVTWCFLNVASSVLIVLVNKYIYEYYGFPNMALTCVHFIVTFLGLVVCQQLNIFQIKKLPILKMIPLSTTFCGFVVFTNLSLEYNTIGTYQIMKFMTTPCVMLISYFFYKTNYSNKVKLSLVSTLGTYNFHDKNNV
jgi:solute carrier family 35, member E3